MDSSTLINQLNEELDTLRQRLGEAERLLSRWLDADYFLLLRVETNVFLNQKGGDVPLNKANLEVVDKAQDVVRIAELEAERDDLRRQLEDAKEQYKILWRRASACGGIGNAETMPLDYALQKIEHREAELAQQRKEVEKYRGFQRESVAALNRQLTEATQRAERAEKELASLKSVRKVTGEQLYELIYVETCNIWEDAPHWFWNEAAARLQLRCTCEPMSVEEMTALIEAHCALRGEPLARIICAHIWPKVEPKPTRDELRGRIVKHRFKTTTVLQLGELEIHTFISDEEKDRWMAERIDECTRKEAEQAAEDWLIDQALKGNP